MNTPSRAGKVAIRIVVASIAMLALGGPSPGHVGSCDGSAERTSYNDFCRVRDNVRCVRDFNNNGSEYAPGIPARITAAEYSTCAADARNETCVGGNYPLCSDNTPAAPTRTQTDACIAALSDPSRFVIPEAMLRECVFSCGGI